MQHYLDKISSLSKSQKHLQAVQLMLSYPMCNWVSQYFGRTRDANAELHFIAFCRDILLRDKEKLKRADWAIYDQRLINYELSAYDQLNEFDCYISLFEYARKNLTYTLTYSKSRTDDDFNKYVLYEDCHYKYVHFLYLSHHRYEIIKRKKARQDVGKLPKTMLRHQIEDLDTSELNSRMDSLTRLLNKIAKYYHIFPSDKGGD